MVDGSVFASGSTNARLKAYPGKTIMQVCNFDIFSNGVTRPRGYDVPPAGMGHDPERAKEISQRRAKAKIMDIALCNPFSYFFTWTLDGQLIDRYDIEIVYKKVRVFLSNAVQRKGFQYVLVPEYHQIKDGEEKPAIHMHGLCNLGKVKIQPACYVKGPRAGMQIQDNSGRPVYNMVAWKYGFSTCIPVDGQYERTVNYLSKYITKSDEKIFGKWYLSSRNLKKSPEIIPLNGINFNEFLDEKKLAAREQILIDLYENGPHMVVEEFPPLSPAEI